MSGRGADEPISDLLRMPGSGTGLQAQVRVQHGDFVLDVDLEVARGEVVGLVGPNGAGKSTLLRALAGLQPIDRGRIGLDGRVLTEPARGVFVPTHLRPVGVVFQDYLLFPHLSVLDNVAFGLRARGMPRVTARSHARDWLDRVEVTELAGVKPGRISGGQAQRVALARALATEPELLLMDEPLAALDARTRLRVRGELRRHLARFAGAAVVVTHDPVDAAVLADRLVVLEAGRVVQVGSPTEVARRPLTDYVARLVGLNVLPGVARGREVELLSGGRVSVGAEATGPVYLAFRPAAVALHPGPPTGSARNVWAGRIVGLEPSGEAVRVEVGEIWDSRSTVVAEVTPEAVLDLDLVVGAPVWAAVKASEIDAYARE